jgi:hypothetical protein
MLLRVNAFSGAFRRDVAGSRKRLDLRELDVFAPSLDILNEQ